MSGFTYEIVLRARKEIMEAQFTSVQGKQAVH